MNTTEFLAAVARAITVPTYQPRFTQQDLLELAFEEQKTCIVPMLIGMEQNYLLCSEELAVVAGTKLVSFPYRAVARSLKNLFVSVGTGRDYELQRYTLGESKQFQEAPSNLPCGFLEIGDDIKLLPTPGKDITAKFYYYRKPSKPVLTKYTGTITAVGVDSLTLSSVPATIAIGSIVDVTKFRPGFSLALLDGVVTNISGNIITLSGFSIANPITSVSVGDSLSTALETSILQLPEEIHDVLVHATAVRVLEALQLPEQLDLVQKQFTRKMQNAQLIMESRIDDQPEIFFHGHPLLGSSMIRGIPNVTVSDT